MKGTEPFQPREKSDATKKKKYHWFTRPSFFNNASLQAATLLPSLSVCLKVALGITTTLYILNQSHLLPKPLSAVVSKTLFWPTLPITVLKRLGRWTTRVDETVLMGGAPFAFAGLPESLHDNYGVRGVINMCEEYRGPLHEYSRLGMKELWLPTVDHFEPSIKDLDRAVQFIERHRKMGSKVYVHCRAGHGRSAAAVFAWLLSKDPTVDRKTLNEDLCKLRDVRTTLWRQPNIIKYHAALLSGDDDGNGRTGAEAHDNKVYYDDS